MSERFVAQLDTPAPFDPATAAANLLHMINDPAWIVIRSAGGFICGGLHPHPWNAQVKQAIEIAWWSEDGAGAHLLGAFENWARAHGAASIVMAYLPSRRGSAVRRVLKRRGYRDHENLMVM